MLVFNELRITPDTKHMIIDVSVQDMPYYDNVYVNSIIIQVSNNFSENNLQGINPDKTFLELPCGDVKHYRTFVDIDSVGNNLFFVYALASGEPAENTPCGGKDEYILGVVYDKCPIYRNLMNGIAALADDNSCNPPQKLMDQFFRYKGFQLAIDTGNYLTAIDYWNMFFKKKLTKTIKTCGCHG